MQPKGCVLIIAGSDPSGGAGIQADIKTVTMLGGYAAAAIAALTAQNTFGVKEVLAVPADFVARQVRLVLEDIGADAIKTGMLLSAEVIHAVADVLEDYPDIPLILDPVMAAKGGAPLLQGDAVEALITPNVPEAEMLAKGDNPMTRLSNDPIGSVEDMRRAGKALLAMGCRAVLMKGGHLEGDTVTDILIIGSSDRRVIDFTSPRLTTCHTHGTGCTLASAIATGIARGMGLEAAVKQAHAYVYEAIRTAPGLGKGCGPVNHSHPLISD
jgi:hydroxymethylpyrimidine/phosphomethylpyrimidine kinase